MSDEEMEVVPFMAADSKESCLAKEWLRAVNQDTTNTNHVFQKLFFQLLSDNVFPCFEVINAQTLKVNVKEEQCQETILNVLEYFLFGEEPSAGLEKLQRLNKPPQLCGKMFKYGDPTFSCRDCGYDGTCVLCIDCFQKSIHKDHQYKMNTSYGSGFCDCGDPEAWKQGPSCDLHKPVSDMDNQENPADKLSPDMVNRAKLLYKTALEHCVQMLCWDENEDLPDTLDIECEGDTYVTMLFNDEVHTYEEVILTLTDAIPQCDREMALAYANTVDREGRSPVRIGQKTICENSRRIIERGTSGPGRSPLKCKVMHHKVVAHQLFVLRLLGWINKITSHSDGLRRLLCKINVETPLSQECLLDKVFQEDAKLWKTARTNTHKVFMNSMLLDCEGKKWFAIHFTKNYKKLMTEFVADDHEHSVSATSFSVQIFTVPTLARMLVLEHDILIVILNTFMEELESKINGNNGTYEFHGPFQPLGRAQYVLLDLKYILQHRPLDWTDNLRQKFFNFLELFLTLLKNMQNVFQLYSATQSNPGIAVITVETACPKPFVFGGSNKQGYQGMDMITRKTGTHIESDPEWESAFTLQLRMMPVLSMVNDWCIGDAEVFRTAVRDATITLMGTKYKYQNYETKDVPVEVVSKSFKVIKYDVSKQPVSIHLPVSRFLAGLLLGCHRHNGDFDELFDFESRDDGLKLFLMEYSVRALVMVAQVHAGMWRRNGYAIMNQVFHYQNVKCRTEMYDKDIIMMQTSAACMESDHFLVNLMDKFGIKEWLLPTSNFDESKEGDKMNHKLVVMEEWLSIIIAIIGERYIPGIGRVTSDDFFRREIIHNLCIKPMAHSELVKALPLPDFVVGKEHSVDHIISSVATFKKPGVTGRGLYELKEEHYKDYNPFFYHYSRIEQSKAEEQHRKRIKKDKSLSACPPPLPPEFCQPFDKILNLLSSKVLMSTLITIITRASTGLSKAINHTHIQQALHLICLGLLEAQRHRESGKQSKFGFIELATTKITNGSQEPILKLLEGLHDNPHVQEHSSLIEWILKKFHAELDALEERDSQERLSQRLSMKESTSQVEDEKARKARLAQEKRNKIMAQMSALQKAFIRENAELLASMETDRSIDDDITHTDSATSSNTSLPVVLGYHRDDKDPKANRFPLEPCILCQEQQEVSTEGRAIVMAAFVQRSTVLSKTRGKMFENGEEVDPLYPPADMFWGLHTSSCGHIMHSDCWQGFFDSVIAKERRALRLRQFISVDVNRREFLCPLCGCICNTVLPIIPPLASEKHESPVDEVTLQEYLSSMQDVVMSNLAAFTSQPVEEVKKEQVNPPSLTERFQSFVHAFTRPGSKFSATLKDMMKVFSEASYTVGLGVDPNQEDVRVPVMVWTACAYTIQSGESAMRAENKPLFNGLTSRQSQCIGALTRLAAVAAGTSDSKTIKLHCLKLLAVLTPDTIPNEESPSLLDLDIFSLMVKLRLSMPSLQYKESQKGKPQQAGNTSPGFSTNTVLGLENSSSMDICSFQLCFAAHLVKTLLTASPELDSTEPEEDTVEPTRDEDEAMKVALLWGKLRHWAGLQSSAPHVAPLKLQRHVKSIVLPFLRCSALFFHFLTEIPGPPCLKEPCTIQEEWDSLCHYLTVPKCLVDILQWNQDAHNISSSVITLAAKRWCSHDFVKKTLAHAGVEPLGYSITPNHLLNLPRDYSELINKASLFTCPNSEGDESRAPVLCLICGEMLCSQSYCCQTEVSGDKVGACAAHAQLCGAGIGIFLRVRECQILLMASRTKGSFYPAPYLDTYGETDHGLRRGNPLYLCPERYNKLQKLWLNHGIAEEVAHSLESNRNLLSIDWTIL